jgi:hypothetical protein
MPNSLTWCDLPEDVSLWPGLPLSLSGDEVMPLDYHAGRSGWLLYGRGLDKRRLTAWQRELGAALVIVASWVVEDYQVIRLAGSLTRVRRDWRMRRGWTSRHWVKFPICAPRAAGDGYGLHGDPD